MIKKFTSIDEVNNKTSDDVFKPKIALIGVGGAGTNAVNNMIRMGLSGVNFVVVNTDSKSLDSSSSPYKLQIGPKVTKGLGAGSKPEIGAQAAEESVEDIREIIKDVNLLFITAGMGGGTGTGASQVIAKLAKEMDILTISFVTKPFSFEGSQKMDIAEQGINELEKYSDSLVVISNQNLFSIIDSKTSLSDAFRETDSVLYSGIKAITDLLVASGLVNLDFNDVKYVIEGKGRAMIGSAESSGENRAEIIAKQAVLNPLLEDVSILGAKSVLINITGSLDMTLHEVDQIINAIKQELDVGAFINFGAIHDENLVDTLRLSIVATSLQDKEKILALKQNKQSDYSNKTLSYTNSVYQKAQNKSNNAYSATSNSTHDVANTDNNSDINNNVERSSEKVEKLSDRGRPLEKQHNYKNNDIAAIKVIDESIMFTTINSNDQESELVEDLEIEDNLFKKPIDKVFIDKRSMEEPLDSLDNLSDEEDYPVVQNRNKNHDKSNDKEDTKSSVNLFDLIMKKDNKKEDNLRNQIQENDIINIKNRNKISKETNMIEEKEDSFFDLPAFLRKGK